MSSDHELDLHAAKALQDALGVLRRGFATGAGKLRDFPAARAAFSNLAETLETEEAVEKRLELQEKLILEEDEAAVDAEAKAGTDAARAAEKEGSAKAGSEPSEAGQEGRAAQRRRRRVCVFVDGSLQAATALKWAVENVVGRQDDLWLANVIPWEAFGEDSGRILADA